jgi:hypothetical protein
MDTSDERILADVRGRVRAFAQQRFEQGVLRRDEHRCRVCAANLNLHAHHIEFLRDVCRRIAAAGRFDTETVAGRRRLIDAILGDPGATPANGITLCPKHHRQAHTGELTADELRGLIAGFPEISRIPNEKLIVREARSLAEVYSIIPLGALATAEEPTSLSFGQLVGFRDFVGAPFRDQVGTLERATTLGDHVMVSFRARLAVPGCRARLHFQFDKRMLLATAE